VKTYTIRTLHFHHIETLQSDYERWTAHSIAGKFRIEREGKEWAWLAPGKEWATCKNLAQGTALANEALTTILEADTLSTVNDGTA
jgi:hypothetical protein